MSRLGFEPLPCGAVIILPSITLLLPWVFFRLQETRAELNEERSASAGEAIINEEDSIRLNSRYILD